MRSWYSAHEAGITQRDVERGSRGETVQVLEERWAGLRRGMFVGGVYVKFRYAHAHFLACI